MPELRTHIDLRVAALLRYMTAPLSQDPPVPLRVAHLPYGVRFPACDVVALAGHAPMLVSKEQLTGAAMLYGADILFARISENGAVSVDVALRHLRGVEVIRAMRIARHGNTLWLIAQTRELWVKIALEGITLSLKRAWNIEEEGNVLTAAVRDLEQLFAFVEER